MRKPRALIFDDEVMILELLEGILKQAGFEVLSFSEPEVCPIYEKHVKKCEKENACADLLITDLQMPKMNGIELLQNQEKRGCPLTMQNKAIITASLDAEYDKAVKELGCTFIGKPFKLSDIKKWLNECEERIDLSRPIG